jgi:ribose transport system ATP-binding protein
MSHIELKNIKKSFGETQALVDASLRTELGEIHAIVGENGSGKSTLAKIMSGVIPCDDGGISVLGGHPKTPAEAISLGVSTIYQEIMVADELTIWENMYAGSDGLRRKSMSSVEKRRRTKDILERLAQTRIDPDEIVGRQPLNIKQWIVIARAIIRDPKILIFDESSAALDLEATNRLHDEMNRMKDAGACIILVTHRIAELVRIADSATVLRDGVTVGRLSKDEITEENILSLMSALPKRTLSRTPRRRLLQRHNNPFSRHSN